MRNLMWSAVMGLALASAAEAATKGRVWVEQIAKPHMQQEAHQAEFSLTQAYAYPRDWVDDESRWSVLAVPAGVDLSGLRASRDPEAWVSKYLQDPAVTALRFAIDPDGRAIEMYVYDRGKLSLGASGTMGDVYGARLEAGRLHGHYLYLGDLFDSPLVIDLKFEAEIWQAPKAGELPADGGEAGAAYLALVKAVHAGDREAILALQPKDKPKPSAAEFQEVLPLMQATMPKRPRIKGGKAFGETVVLSIVDEADQSAGSAELRREDGRWVMLRASSGADRSAGLPTPPSFTAAPTDPCPQLLDEGVICGDVDWADKAWKIRHLMAAQSGESQHLVLLAPGKLDPAHADALWDSEAPLAPLFTGGEERGLLLIFDGANGTLSGQSGFVIDPEEGFDEDFNLRANAVRIGDRIYGEFKVEETDPETGDSSLRQILRFTAPVHDKR